MKMKKYVLLGIVIVVTTLVYNLFFKTYYLNYDYKEYAGEKINYLEISYRYNDSETVRKVIVKDEEKIKKLFAFINELPLKISSKSESEFSKLPHTYYIGIFIDDDENINQGWLSVIDNYILRSQDLEVFEAVTDKNIAHDLLSHL